MTEALKDSDLMPFGKYKGEKIGDVPANYLLWWFHEQRGGECRHPELRDHIEKNLKHLQKEVNEASKR